MDILKTTQAGRRRLVTRLTELLSSTVSDPNGVVSRQLIQAIQKSSQDTTLVVTALQRLGNSESLDVAELVAVIGHIQERDAQTARLLQQFAGAKNDPSVPNGTVTTILQLLGEDQEQNQDMARAVEGLLNSVLPVQTPPEQHPPPEHTMKVHFKETIPDPNGVVCNLLSLQKSSQDTALVTKLQKLSNSESLDVAELVAVIGCIRERDAQTIGFLQQFAGAKNCPSVPKPARTVNVNSEGTKKIPDPNGVVSNQLIQAIQKSSQDTRSVVMALQRLSKSESLGVPGLVEVMGYIQERDAQMVQHLQQFAGAQNDPSVPNGTPGEQA